MEYEWGEDKRLLNLEKHGWDFAEAHRIWDEKAPVNEEYSERKGEERWIAVGRIGSKTVSIIYEDVAEDRKRIISMRDASDKERIDYERLLLRETGKANDISRLIDDLTRE